MTATVGPDEGKSSGSMNDWIDHCQDFDFANAVPPGEVPGRGLSLAEIGLMEKAGSSSPDWSRIRVHPRFNPRSIYCCHFSGNCYLGLFENIDPDIGDPRLQGLFSSTIHNSLIGSASFLSGIGLLSGYVVGSGVRITGCATITATPGGISSLTEHTLTIGNETGSRKIPLLPGLSHEEGCGAISGSASAKNRERLSLRAEALASAWKRLPGFIAAGTSLSGCGPIVNTLIGPASCLSGVAALDTVFIDSSFALPTILGAGSILHRSVLAPGCRVDTHALVKQAILCQDAVIENHASVNDAWIGEGTVVGGGEVTASFLGPYTAMHHQSLLIAALWPAGRGNIGYGANIGSNHTGRAPDQEILIGEGCFFGLGSSVKYPADFTDAPGTIVASGVVVPPGRIRFPFSLILPDPSGTPCLKPGWVWSASPYTLARNRAKHSLRSGRPVPFFSLPALRAVLASFLALSEESGGAFAGGCTLHKADRKAGLEAYRSLLRFGLLERAVAEDASILFDDAALDSIGLSRGLLEQPARCADLYSKAFCDFVEGCRVSRQRDHDRGLAIQPESYQETHDLLKNDPVMQALASELAAL